MVQWHSFVAVKTTEVLNFKKVSLLLAMLLCSVLAFAVPVASKAAIGLDTPKERQVHASDEAPFSVIAGEVSAGEAEGVLPQVEKLSLSMLPKLLLQQLYPEPINSEAVPAHAPFHLGSSIRHSILTKGP